MDSSDAIQFLILILLICLSAFFSSAETSMTTVNKIRIQSLAEQGDKKAQTLLKVIEDSGKLLSSILIGNNIVNITASSLATTITMRLFGNAAVSISTGIITLLVLIFGEITPKTLATLHAEKNGSCLCQNHSSAYDYSHTRDFYYKRPGPRCIDADAGR